MVPPRNPLLELKRLKLDLLGELHKRYGNNREKWKQSLRFSLDFPDVPKYQRAAMKEVLHDLEMENDVVKFWED